MHDRSTILNWDRFNVSYNDLITGWFRMIVQKWCKGIVTDDRSTVGIRGG